MLSPVNGVMNVRCRMSFGAINFGIMICSVIGMFWWYFSEIKDFEEAIKQNPFDEYEQPQTAATLGVLGTFFGLCVGLILFSVEGNNLTDSVGALLNGLRTAFVTSVIGMIMSLLLKRKQKKEKEAAFRNGFQNDVTSANILDFLRHQEQVHQQQTKDFIELIKNNNSSLILSINGHDENALVGQLEKMRAENLVYENKMSKFYQQILSGQENLKNEVKNNNDKLIEEFEKFANTLAECNSKALIDALNDTMKNFNVKLKEQFGENFKKFDEAVIKLLEWQEQYKQTIEKTTENQKMIFEHLANVDKSIGGISQSVKGLIDTGNKLGEMIITADTYATKLSEIIMEINSLSENADRVIPDIEAMLQAATDEMQKNAEATAVNLQEISDETAKSLKETADNTLKEIKEANQNALSGMGLYVTELNHKTEEAITAIQQHSKAIMSEAEAQQKSITENAVKVQKVIQDSTSSVESNAIKVQERMENALEVLVQNSSQIQRAIKDSAEQLRQGSFEVTVSVTNKLKELSKKVEEDNKAIIETGIKNLENLLHKTLEASIEMMGKDLARVSQKMVNDYTPLTEKMRKLIELADKIDNQRSTDSGKGTTERYSPFSKE